MQVLFLRLYQYLKMHQMFVSRLVTTRQLALATGSAAL